MEQDSAFAEEVQRITAANVVGRNGRLRELFDFLAARGPGAPPASQAEIAQEVFGQMGAEGDDATARVYIHRLRKRLERFYEREPGDGARLVLPAGSYGLVLEQSDGVPAPPVQLWRKWRWALPVAAVLALALSFAAGRETSSPGTAAEGNAIWQPFLDSDRPIMVAVGDYYMFGELDPFDPERSRLIRDFAIDSPTDLARAQETDPARYEKAEDVGLTYLPFSTAYGLRSIMPVLARHPKPVRIMPASQVDSSTLRDFNVVYVGLVSGMGLLEDVNFMNSDLQVGQTYDELDDNRTGKKFNSGEALSRVSPEYYQDFAYITRFHEPGGALLAVVAGARDTGLRGIAPIAAGHELPRALRQVADGNDDFEAVFRITGQQGADLGQTLALARPREGNR
ncbi:hypothetical protein GRI89_05340 [Altererythrobacter salegens]|uniref:OmpR/PhoB-type domain-containing protein n=1 Tax=Croceibacterium salegens TaxID=1737568 RepID=A0A6I4SV85_9SPHN|nr:helix-turn-helix domain-containing protein [Croceibacterium salegens]MXO58960.1 hypothetical protein [Croceibacterium salegens]